MWIITPYNKVDTSFYTVKVIRGCRKSWIVHVAPLVRVSGPGRRWENGGGAGGLRGMPGTRRLTFAVEQN